MNMKMISMIMKMILKVKKKKRKTMMTTMKIQKMRVIQTKLVKSNHRPYKKALSHSNLLFNSLKQ